MPPNPRPYPCLRAQAGIAFFPQCPDVLVLHALVLLELKHEGPIARSHLLVRLRIGVRARVGVCLWVWVWVWVDVWRGLCLCQPRDKEGCVCTHPGQGSSAGPTTAPAQQPTRVPVDAGGAALEEHCVFHGALRRLEEHCVCHGALRPLEEHCVCHGGALHVSWRGIDARWLRGTAAPNGSPRDLCTLLPQSQTQGTPLLLLHPPLVSSSVRIPTATASTAAASCTAMTTALP